MVTTSTRCRWRRPATADLTATILERAARCEFKIKFEEYCAADHELCGIAHLSSSQPLGRSSSDPRRASSRHVAKFFEVARTISIKQQLLNCS